MGARGPPWLILSVGVTASPRACGEGDGYVTIDGREPLLFT
jgi:hypothetical protein